MILLLFQKMAHPGCAQRKINLLILSEYIWQLSYTDAIFFSKRKKFGQVPVNYWIAWHEAFCFYRIAYAETIRFLLFGHIKKG